MQLLGERSALPRAQLLRLALQLSVMSSSHSAPLKLRPYGAIQICLLLLLFVLPSYSVLPSMMTSHN